MPKPPLPPLAKFPKMLDADDSALPGSARTGSALARLKRQFSSRPHGGVLSATMTIAALSALGRGVAIVKDLIVASRFGRSDSFEAFVNAFVLPLLIVGTFSSAANSALVSTYVSALVNRGRTQANQLLARVNAITFVAMSGLAIALLLAARPVLAPLASGFSPEKMGLQRHLFLLMLPIIPLSGLTTIWSAALNAEGAFARVALSPIVIPICTIVALLLYGSPSNGLPLALGMTTGFAAQTLTLGVLASRAGVTIMPRWSTGADDDVSLVIRLFFPALLAAMLMSSTTAVDQGMAAMLPAGSVAAFNYGTKLVSVITGLGATALSTSLIPHLSRLVARRNWADIRRLLRSYSLIILGVTVPLTLLLYVGSGFLVSHIFQRGTFNAEDARVVARVQAFLSLQIPAFAVGTIFVSLVIALRNTRVFVAGNIINVASNVALNWLLMQEFGVAGIALSTSFVYLISCFFLMTVAYRLLLREEQIDRTAGTLVS